ncbi:MAG: type IV pilus assembly protein PilM [PVC group bacterium]|nr:type IV pilus assembly protein PilM [PVC group bacterium]
MFFKRYQEAVGVEIGDGLVKALYIASNEKENKLLGFEMVEVNFRDGRDGIINAIKEVMSRLPLKKKKCKINISVSGESVVVRDIHWPQMGDSEIRKALKFEVERQVHYKMEDIVFDYYSVLDKKIAETKTRVILVAAKKDLIENYASLITSTGYTCGLIEVDTFSLLNCFYVNGPDVSNDKTIALINVGMEVTNIDIIKGKVVGLTKDGFVAWSNLIDALPKNLDLDFNNLSHLKGLNGSDDIYELCLFILNALSNQIRRAIEYYETQGRDTVEELFLSGRVAMFKGLEKYLQGVLGLKVTVWNPIAKLIYEPTEFKKKQLKDNSLMLALCAGLACYRSFSINLSSDKAAVRRNKIWEKLVAHKKFIYAGAGILTVLIALWIGLFTQLKIKETNKIRLEEKYGDLTLVLEEIDKLKEARQILDNQMEGIRALLKRRVSWSEKLQEISANLPQDIWLTRIYTATKDIGTKRMSDEFMRLVDTNLRRDEVSQVLNINGVAYAEHSEQMLSLTSGLISSLKNDMVFAKDFSRIELIRSFREVRGASAVMRFEIQAVLK